LATAVHAMALVLVAEGEKLGRAITSDEMAANVGVHAVHVRRVLATLKKAGLVTSQPGPGGGWSLAKPADAISLGAIYLAVEQEGPFSMPEGDPAACCRFIPELPAILQLRLDQAEQALIAELDTVTLADLVADSQMQNHRVVVQGFSRSDS